jgi:hypothetical protein
MRKRWSAALISLFIVSLVVPASATDVNGTLTKVDGLSVMRVSGRPTEQAHWPPEELAAVSPSGHRRRTRWQRLGPGSPGLFPRSLRPCLSS